MDVLSDSPLKSPPIDYCPQGSEHWYEIPEGFDAGKKLFYFDYCEVFFCRADARFWMRALITALFIIQWPIMPGMFFLAPLPIAHAAAEIYVLSLALLAYGHWRDLRSKERVDRT